MTDDTSSDSCRAWLRARGLEVDRLEPMPGDVSVRRYLRAHTTAASWIVATYPEGIRPTCHRWIVTDRLLSAAGVRTPRIMDADCAAGFMLLEDLGPETLQDRAASDGAAIRPWLTAAVDAAERIRLLEHEAVAALQPPLGAEVLAAELEQSWSLVLDPTGRSPSLAAALRRGLDRLVAELASSPPEPCHRDFMARNLVPLTGGAVAVLDHQDLRLGPPFYDLASLTNDTLYLSTAATDALLGERLEPPGARLAFHRAAAQRTLKIVGTFEAFRRRGDARHVPLIRPSLEAALRHLAQLPETAELVPRLRDAWSGPHGPLLD